VQVLAMIGLRGVPTTDPRQSEPTPHRTLDRDRLEERLLNLLSSQTVCLLANAGPDRPLVSRVRYYSLGFAVLFTAAANSRKLRNIAADPRVSLGISAPLDGLASSRGAHLFGTASGPVSEPRRDTLVIVEPERIVYSEQSLRDEGFASLQFWHR
jgi:hypothetical protein